MSVNRLLILFWECLFGCGAGNGLQTDHGTMNSIGCQPTSAQAITEPQPENIMKGISSPKSLAGDKHKPLADREIQAV